MARNAVADERTVYDAVVRGRLASQDKKAATRVIQNMGLTVSDAIRIMMSLTAKEGCLPFEIRQPMPNAATHEAIEELKSGKGKKFATVEGLMADLEDDSND